MKIGIIDTLRQYALKALGSSQADVRALIRGDSIFKGFDTPTFRRLVNEGYKCNGLVHFMVKDIARSGAGVPLDLEGQPQWVIDIMGQPQKPNDSSPGQLYKSWMRDQMIFKQLSGSAYAESTPLGEGRNARVADLPIIRPDWITPMTSGGEELSGWQVNRFGRSKEFAVNEIFWSKDRDPLDETRGFPALAAANKSLSQINETARLNMQMLKNDGAVKGFMKLLKQKDGLAKQPDKDQMKEIKKAVNEKFGADSDGMFPVVNGDMDWVSMGMNAREMDWLKGKELTMRELAITLGYPPFLLGFSQGSTFNNISEARQFLWNHTIIPQTEDILCDLAVHFRMVSGDDSIELKMDKTKILSIQEQMAIMREGEQKFYDSGLITREEWRSRNGFDETPIGDFKLDLNVLSLPLDDR